MQSELFNRCLAERVTRGELSRWVDGDLAVRHAHGRPWLVTEAEAAELYPPFEASATGPMFGPKMPSPGASSGEREAAVLAASGVTLSDLARAGELAEGARRMVRVRAEGIELSRDKDALRFAFTLQPGAYATVVLREFMKSRPGRRVETDRRRWHPTCAQGLVRRAALTRVAVRGVECTVVVSR